MIVALSSNIIELDRSSAIQDCVAAHQKIKLLEAAHYKVKAEPDKTLKKDLSNKNCLVNSVNMDMNHNQNFVFIRIYLKYICFKRFV